jgi:hypothetical protein
MICEYTDVICLFAGFLAAVCLVCAAQLLLQLQVLVRCARVRIGQHVCVMRPNAVFAVNTLRSFETRQRRASEIRLALNCNFTNDFSRLVSYDGCFFFHPLSSAARSNVRRSTCPL